MSEKQQENTIIKQILPSAAQNLGPVGGNGNERETTGKEKQDKEEQKTRKFGWAYLVIRFSCC